MRVTHGDIIFIDVPDDASSLADNYVYELEEWIKNNQLQNVKIVKNAYVGATTFNIRVFSADDSFDRIVLGQ